ncbi:MAG: PAS domain-containing sensor histidine kinase [Phototrophicales bacterium]|nr:PAS domain-containing sensor histidine kinase [Phototrophicales bacterium]
MSTDKFSLIQDEMLTFHLHQHVLQAAGYAIVSFNLDGTIVYATDSIAHLTGYLPDELIGQDYEALLHLFTPADMVIRDSDFEHDFQSKQSLTHLIITKDGESKWIEYRIIQPIEDELIHTLVQDVTQRYRAEQALAQQIRESAKQYDEIQALFEKVNKLEQLKSDMIRVAAHDLRSPLSVFVTHLDVMSLELSEEGFIPDKKTLLEHLEDMRHATKRMRRIIEDILSLERIEQNAQHAEYSPVELTSMVRGIFRDYESQAKNHAHQFTLTCPTTPIIIQGDIAQLREAISNLISNALKYTPEMGRIEVVAMTKGNCARFEVIDTGYGIPKDKQTSLFQPFYRAKSKETRHIEGTGLGLYLVKNIVERHHGTLIFKSVQGKGSHFGFEIPCIPSPL